MKRTAAIAALVTLASSSPQRAVAAVPACTSASAAGAYAPVRAEMTGCETLTGLTLALPMTKAKKQKLCATCTTLLGGILDGKFPACRVTQNDGQTFKLQKFLERLFRPCVGGSSASDSANGSLSDDDDNDNEVATGVPSTSQTPSPTNLSARSSNSTATDSSRSSGSQTSAVIASIEGSSTSTGMIIGIVAGGIVFVLAMVGFLVCRRKRRAGADKFASAMPNADDSSTGRATVPFQLSLASVAGGSSNNKKSRSSNHYSSNSNNSSDYDSFQPAMSGGTSRARNLWEDPNIIAARIPKDKVVVTTMISRGGFGEVYRGIYNHQAVAVKMLLPETRKDLEEINAFLAEVKLMAMLEHERIVTFVGVAWDSLNDICAVTEFMEGGDLRGMLVEFESTRRSHGFDHDKVKIALHVAHALTYMHSFRPVVLHRDLKSKNILLDNQLNAKLTDFGVSRESSVRTMTAGVGTSLWMAPEVMMGERYNEKADIFSFGVVLSELDTHAVPYSSAKQAKAGYKIPDSAVLQMVSLGKLRVEFSTSDSIPEMAELGKACVAMNPKDRPTTTDVLYTLHNALNSMYAVM